MKSIEQNTNEQSLESFAKAAKAVPITPDFGPQIEGYAPYLGQSTCDPTPKPGVVAFKDLILRTYPGTRDLGIRRECNIGGLSEHKEGRAWDWGVNVNVPAERAAADELLAWLLATDRHGNQHAMARRLGIMYIIWNRKAYESYSNPPFKQQPYSGDHPHTDHVHFSFSWPGARKETSFWNTTSPNGRPIALKAANGQYVVAEGGGGREVRADRNDRGPWETFELIQLGGNRVALKAANGQYVVAEGGGGREVLANRNAVGPWETFELIQLGGNRVALKAANGQYVVAEGGGGREVLANRNAVGPWETFELINL